MGLLFLGVIVATSDISLAQSDEGILNFASTLSVLLDVIVLIFLKSVELNDVLIRPNILVSDEALTGIRPMWVMTRNIVNVIVVGWTSFLAFYNMIGSASGKKLGNLALQSQLPKIMLGIILINFSLLAFRTIIEVTHVAYMSIVTVGTDNYGTSEFKAALTDTLYDQEGNECLSASTTCKSMTDWFNQYNCPLMYGDDTTVSENDCMFVMDADGLSEYTPDGTPNIFLAWVGPVWNFHNIQQLSNSTTSLNTYAKNVQYNMLFGLVFMIVNMMIFFALIARVVVLWVAMTVAPFLVFFGFLGLLPRQGKVMQMVITHLIMPIKIALAFTITFVMISTLQGFTDLFTEQVFIQEYATLNSGDGLGFLWQLVTVLVFWQTAKWAIDGNAASVITNYITEKVEGAGRSMVGKAESATMDGFNESMKSNGTDDTIKKAMVNFRNIGAGAGEFVGGKVNEKKGDGYFDGELSVGAVKEKFNFADRMMQQQNDNRTGLQQFGNSIQRTGGDISKIQKPLLEMAKNTGGLKNLNKQDIKDLAMMKDIPKELRDELNSQINNGALSGADLDYNAIARVMNPNANARDNSIYALRLQEGYKNDNEALADINKPAATKASEILLKPENNTAVKLSEYRLLQIMNKPDNDPNKWSELNAYIDEIGKQKKKLMEESATSKSNDDINKNRQLANQYDQLEDTAVTLQSLGNVSVEEMNITQTQKLQSVIKRLTSMGDGLQEWVKSKTAAGDYDYRFDDADYTNELKDFSNEWNNGKNELMNDMQEIQEQQRDLIKENKDLVDKTGQFPLVTKVPNNYEDHNSGIFIIKEPPKKD